MLLTCYYAFPLYFSYERLMRHQENFHGLILCFIFLIVCFIRGHNLDPDDSEVLFHLALNQALMRQVCYNV